MENRIAYTLAMWRVKEGREEEFVRAWREDLADFFLSLPSPPLFGTLIRSVGDIRRMRSNLRATAVLGSLEVLCEQMKPGNFREVLTLP